MAANPTLNWTINKERGTISFGRLLPVTGNTYTISIEGGTAGDTYTFYVMDDSGEVCLAGSETTSSVTTISFNTQALRDRFAKDWHETRTFHCVCSDGTNTIAEGDVPITWNPVWTVPEIGSAYSMRGPQGVGISAVEFVSVDTNGNYIYQFRLTNGSTVQFISPRGDIGPGANANYVKYADGEYYKLQIYKNRYGEAVVEVDQTPVSEVPGVSEIVTISGEQTITGKKTFSTPIHGNLMGNVTGNLTGNVTGNITGNVTGNVTGDVTGDITGDVDGDLTGSVDATGSGKRVQVRTMTAGDNGTDAASTAFVQQEIGNISKMCGIRVFADPTKDTSQHTISVSEALIPEGSEIATCMLIVKNTTSSSQTITYKGVSEIGEGHTKTITASSFSIIDFYEIAKAAIVPGTGFNIGEYTGTTYLAVQPVIIFYANVN